MSFYTSVKLVRPGNAVGVTCDQVAGFLSALHESRMWEGIRGYWGGSVSLAFGKCDPDEVLCVDDDEEEVWDFKKRYESVPELLGGLKGLGGEIRRGYLSLGPANSQVLEYLQSKEPKSSFTPDSWGLLVGPVRSGSLSSDETYIIGGMSLSYSGGGYLYPWRFRDLVKHLELHPDLQRVMALCKKTWPVAVGRPSPKLVTARRKMGDLWGYDDVERPVDWMWSLHETG